MLKKSDNPIVGMCFIGADGNAGQIIAQISDGYFLAQFEYLDDEPLPLAVLSAADLCQLCDDCGGRHWLFFPDVKAREKWLNLVDTPVKEKKVVHLKPVN
jgi:hypothetical protein